MTVPIGLLLLALVALFFALFFGAKKGSISLLLMLLVAAIVASTMSADWLMMVSYGLAFGFPVVAGSIFLGVTSGVALRKKNYLLSILCLLPFVYFIWNTNAQEGREANEKSLAHEFVTSNTQLILLLGGRVKTSEVSSTVYSDKSRGKYEFSIQTYSQQNRPLYAILEVSRGSGKLEFKLACVTSKYMGQREAGKGACDDGVIALKNTETIDEKDRDTLETAKREMNLCRFSGLTLPSKYSIFVAEAQNDSKGIGLQIDKSGLEATQIDVVVNSPNKQAVLVLIGANSPNIWNIKWSKDTQITAVLASGAHKQVVAGLDKQTPIVSTTFNDKDSCTDFYLTPERPDLLDPVVKRFFERSIDNIYKPTNGKIAMGMALPASTQLITSAQNPPSIYFDKNAPRTRKAGLEDGLQKGLLRKATQDDVQAWIDAVGKNSLLGLEPNNSGKTVSKTDQNQISTAYVVLAPFIYPAGLHGGYAVSFLIPKNTVTPEGNPGHSNVYDFNTMLCKGASCGR